MIVNNQQSTGKLAPLTDVQLQSWANVWEDVLDIDATCSSPRTKKELMTLSDVATVIGVLAEDALHGSNHPPKSIEIPMVENLEDSPKGRVPLPILRLLSILLSKHSPSSIDGNIEDNVTDNNENYRITNYLSGESLRTATVSTYRTQVLQTLFLVVTSSVSGFTYLNTHDCFTSLREYALES